ncbi:MAG: ATP-binding cassette domain-containing protein [Thermodesulfobacteriota bacterium]|jgi:ABC-type lipoprotein export system ATPase subunit
MKIDSIKIIGGFDKSGARESVEEVVFRMGDIASIVGPTGCGKTTLINDIELFANGDTPSGRKLLINDLPVSSDEAISEKHDHPIALISQHTNFLSDLPVQHFLEIHAGVRQHQSIASVVHETLEFANKLTGEPLIKESPMTELSGGQTRALLIADAVIIGNAPIILLDEIENAGIHRTRALELLKKYEKIFIFVTHDPRIALLSDFRIVMENGAMTKIIISDGDEKVVAKEISKLDDVLLHFRMRIRRGEQLTSNELENHLKNLGYLT